MFATVHTNILKNLHWQERYGAVNLQKFYREKIKYLFYQKNPQCGNYRPTSVLEIIHKNACSNMYSQRSIMDETCFTVDSKHFCIPCQTSLLSQQK